MAHTFLSCDGTEIAHNDQYGWSGIAVASKHDVWNDSSSCLEWSMFVDRVVRFGEGTFVIGTCKKQETGLDLDDELRHLELGTKERQSRNVS